MYFFIRWKLLFRETLCYLRDSMPCQWLSCFSVLAMLLVWHYTTQWSSGIASVLLTGRYATPVVTWWSTTSATGLRKRFLLSGVFYLALLLAFRGFPWTGSSTSKLAGLHADFRNIAPPRIFVWITPIHKRFICGRFYLRATACKSQYIKLHGILILSEHMF